MKQQPRACVARRTGHHCSAPACHQQFLSGCCTVGEKVCPLEERLVELRPSVSDALCRTAWPPPPLCPCRFLTYFSSRCFCVYAYKVFDERSKQAAVHAFQERSRDERGGTINHAAGILALSEHETSPNHTTRGRHADT